MSYAIPQERPRNSERFVRWGFILLCAGLLSLFTGYEVRALNMVIKPFDAIAILVVPIMLLGLMLTHGLRFSGATAVFGAYILVHVWSAFAMGSANGIRETVQGTELILFFLVLHCLVDRIDWPALGKFFMTGLILVVIYTAIWHISQGFYAGWKRLDEPKLAFLFLPAIIASFAVFRARRFRIGGFALGAVIFGVVLLSGERKAFLYLFALAGILLWYRYFDIMRFSIFVGVVLAVAAIFASSNEYVSHQFSSLAGLGAERFVSSAELQAGYVPTSLSNAQRVFAMEVADGLIQAHPLFGIGTNAYVEYIKANFPGIADWLTTGIHNEFLRVLVENGMVGFIAYCAIWIRCVMWFLIRGRRMPAPYAATYLIFFFAFLMQIAFEGSGQELFLMAVFVALMPEIFSIAAWRPRRPARRRGFEEPAESVVEGPHLERPVYG